MILRRAMIVVTILGAFLIGGIGGIGGIVFCSTRERSPELWEIGPEWRRDEVDSMFADYKAGRIIDTVNLTALGSRLKVRVVSDRFRGANYGFIPLAELGESPTHLWYDKTGEFELRMYDSSHVFVTLTDRYVHELMRNAADSGYHTGPGEAKK